MMPCRRAQLRASAHRDHQDRSIVITPIGRSWSRKSASWSPGSEHC